MNPFEQMQLKQSSYTDTDWQVYAAINENIDEVLRNTATGFAEEFNVSQPALTRFCKKLGFRGFSEFKMAVYQYHKSAAMDESPETAIDYYCQLLRRIPQAMNEADIDGLVGKILSARCVFTTGFHKSSLSAQLMSFNLYKFSIATSFLPYDTVSVSDQFARKDDVLIIFSATSKVYRDTVETLTENLGAERPHIVLVTMNAKNPLRSKVDQTIWLPSYQNQTYPQYLETQISFAVFIDLLTSAIAQVKSSTHAAAQQ